jgi:translation initiation factor 2 subunit 2
MIPDFEYMLDEAYTLLDNNNRNIRLNLPDPIIESTPTRFHWKNVKDFLKILHRHPEHFMDFMKKSMPNREINWFSESKSEGIVILGKYQKKNEIIDVITKYTTKYVICSSCKNPNTKLDKTDTKLLEFECFNCGMKKNL